MIFFRSKKGNALLGGANSSPGYFDIGSRTKHLRSSDIYNLYVQDVNVKDDVKSGVLCPYMDMPRHFDAILRRL